MPKLALGTANFGMQYGVSNQLGQLTRENVTKILEFAHASGIRTLDTATAYGESQNILGEIGVKNWRVISKISPIPSDCKDVSGFITDQFETTLNRLRVDSLVGLLIHHAADLLEEKGDEIFRTLEKLQSNRLVEKIGISIYDPKDLETITQRYQLGIVQAPINVFDTRISNSGWPERFENAGVEIHARSVFLQGLLLSKHCQSLRFFRPWQTQFDQWDNFIGKSGQSRLGACITHVKSYSQISNVIVGVDSKEQLVEIIEAFKYPAIRAPSFESNDLIELINPSLWETA